MTSAAPLPRSRAAVREAAGGFCLTVDVVSAIALENLRALPYAQKKSLCEEDSDLSAVRSRLDLKGAEAELAKAHKAGAWVIAYRSEGYPRWLSEIPDPPLVLFGIGELPPADAVLLGVVGPRRPSPYGARVARMLCSDLAREGVVLVSGMARGIDAIAHEAALRAKVPTIAVLGCGVDQTYPPEHALLKERIAKGGAVVSEFLCGEPPRKEHFPQRNRIISGLCRGVLLVEAGERSGARITARHAVEQGRDVFAVPGPIDSPLSIWPNRLIRDGARMATSTADILEEWIPGFRAKEEKSGRVPDLASLSSGARRLFTRMSCDTPLSIDDLVRSEGSSVSHVLQTLVELEMKGMISKQSDARYLRRAG